VVEFLCKEYAVASELCKRGFYAQLTLGNHKKTDLVVEDAFFVHTLPEIVDFEN